GTSRAANPPLIHKPTSRREKRSITAATYSQPSAVHTYVKSAIHLPLGADASKVRSSTFAATAVACRPPRSGGRRRRRGRALRACSRQPLDPMQTARQPFRQHVFPHPPGAVGPVARNEAGADLCAKLFVTAAALTARTVLRRDGGSRSRFFDPVACSNASLRISASSVFLPSTRAPGSEGSVIRRRHDLFAAAG